MLARPRGEHLDHRSGPKPALQPPEAHAAVVGGHGPALPRTVAPAAAHPDIHAGRPADAEQAHARARARRAHAQAHDRERPEQLGRERRDHDGPVDRVAGPVAVDDAQADAVEARREGQQGADGHVVVEGSVPVQVPRVAHDRPVEVDGGGGHRHELALRRSDGREAEVGDRGAVSDVDLLFLSCPVDIHANRHRVLTGGGEGSRGGGAGSVVAGVVAVEVPGEAGDRSRGGRAEAHGLPGQGRGRRVRERGHGRLRPGRRREDEDYEHEAEQPHARRSYRPRPSNASRARARGRPPTRRCGPAGTGSARSRRVSRRR